MSEILKTFNTIGDEELTAVSRVLKSGILSQFVGSDTKDFMGGAEVRQLEDICCEKFGVKHAVSVNSWTSGLICALGALDLEPGDEVIVPTWTMSASATSILHWNAIPVFCDIDPITFNIDVQCAENLIGPKTKAIMAVDIFGLPADWMKLEALCKRYNLKLIFDSAQSPGAMRQGEIAGTRGDIGGYSLNYHKHIHCGEGGLIFTDDAQLHERMCLIRNHAEAVIAKRPGASLNNMLGYNFRLGEIEAAIAKVQFTKLDDIISQRISAAEIISNELSDLPGLIIPPKEKETKHVYYVFGMLLENDLQTSRKDIITELNSEGIFGLMDGYANIHQLPMYQAKIAYGNGNFPWVIDGKASEVTYTKGICPVAELLHDRLFLGFEMCKYQLDEQDIEKFINVFREVWYRVT